jgi:hypothetical protein
MTYEEAFEKATEQTYYRGAPPSVGWWPTRSEEPKRYAMRWWNGRRWSIYCDQEDAEMGLLNHRSHMGALAPGIRWTYPWW